MSARAYVFVWVSVCVRVRERDTSCIAEGIKIAEVANQVGAQYTHC